MYHFEYVTKNERKKEKAKLIQLLNLVQDEVIKKFTFRFDFVGSDKRNMVTCDRKCNIGYDFDVNIEVNDDDENYSPKMIKTILIKAFNKYANKFNYSQCENNTRVITIKNDEIFILMIQSILHLILIIVIVILSIIKPLTSGLCLMVILVCLYLLMILRSDLLLYKLWYK